MAESERNVHLKLQETEIQELVEKFGKQCKVASNVGIFSHVVFITLDGDDDFSIKFEMEGM